jgi:hypothetical protein
MVENTPPTLRRTTMRNKFSKLVLTAIFGLALAFMLSCSDDDGGGTVACKHTVNSINICTEISGGEAPNHKGEVKEGCEDEGGTYYDSCPSGHSLKCKDVDEDNGMQYYYVYSDLFTNCEEFCNTSWVNNFGIECK